MTCSERKAYEAACEAASKVELDFPVLPTSESNPSPYLPEDAGDNLTPAQRLAVAALVCGRSFIAAAREASVTRRTLFNWRHQPAFQRAVDETSREAMATVVVRMRNLMLRATRVTSESMVSHHAAPNFALRVLNSKQIWSVAQEGISQSEDDAAADAPPIPVEGGADAAEPLQPSAP